MENTTTPQNLLIKRILAVNSILPIYNIIYTLVSFTMVNDQGLFSIYMVPALMSFFLSFAVFVIVSVIALKKNNTWLAMFSYVIYYVATAILPLLAYKLVSYISI